MGDIKTLKPRLEKGNYSTCWVAKIEENMERDRRYYKKLLFLGWTVIHFWGRDILHETDLCVKVVQDAIIDILIDKER